MLRFHLDEQVDTALGRALQRAGIDVTTTVGANLRGVPDDVQIAFASSQNRVLVTRDRDFLVLHSADQNHAGIIYFEQNRFSTGYMVRKLTQLSATLDPEEMVGQVRYG